MLGIIKKTKAFWGGRKGVKLLQPFYDFVRLLKKEPVEYVQYAISNGMDVVLFFKR